MKELKMKSSVKSHLVDGDDFEDFVLGHLAKERADVSTNEDFVSAEDVKRRFGLN